MQIIRPDYGTGHFLGYAFKKDEIDLKMIANIYKLYYGSVVFNWNFSYHRKSKDYLNFCDKLEQDIYTDFDKSINFKMMWPDKHEDDIYCYIGIFRTFRIMKKLDDKISSNDKVDLNNFSKEFKIDKELLDIIFIGDDDA